ncbi:MAG: TetR/AcrR family transcriptional regulator [Caulobacteraceae bacterium]
MITEHSTRRRAELLEAIVDVMLEEGVADLSLRPLAERVGSSARLLIYHFDSKESLIAAALERVRGRIADALHAYAQEQPSTPSLRTALTRFWRWATAEPNQPYFRLLFEIDGLAMYGRLRVSPDAWKDGAAVWQALVRRADAASGEAVAAAPGRTVLIWTSIAALLQDFLATGDDERTEEAFEYLLNLLERGGVG